MAQESEKEIAERVKREWEGIEKNAATPGSGPYYRPQESESERSARTPGSKNPVLKRLKREHPDWPELQ